MNAGSKQRRTQIPYITLDELQNSDIVERYIYPNMNVDYYWSDDFSPEMYIALARAGFISITHRSDERVVLLPEMQTEYAVLDFSNLHISKNVKKLLKNGDYTLSFNTQFSEVIRSIQEAYVPCWIRGEYIKLMHELQQNSYEDFKLFSTELFDNESGEMVAGEIGYITKNIYTSLSGFHNQEKTYDNLGTLQLVLLGQHLEEQGVKFWNLGHPYMDYKIDLGAKILSRGDFLKKWLFQ